MAASGNEELQQQDPASQIDSRHQSRDTSAHNDARDKVTLRTNKSSGNSQKIARQSSKERLHAIREHSTSKSRSRRITICSFCLISAICCLTPFTSIHLTQRVGLLLFESDLLQLRSSFMCVIIGFIFLVIFNWTILIISNRTNHHQSRYKNQLLQGIISKLLSLLAFIGAVSYLSIALVVPHIHQTQRMPIATFDCNANLIIIENCQQQFTSQHGEISLSEAIRELMVGDLNGNDERLIRKLNCLKYNNHEMKTLQVPTRFLLHNCGLVCKPHRQQLHQFNDDLNKNQNWPQVVPEDGSMESSAFSSLKGDHQMTGSKLSPPYSQLSPEATSGGSVITSADATPSRNPIDESESLKNHVSMKVCFSGEFSGGSNYKQFCITNLANRGTLQSGHELTVGQLNAMLRSFTPGQSLSEDRSDSVPIDSIPQESLYRKEPFPNVDHATHYVNPVVQFESHFKNWPNLPTIVRGSEGLWDIDSRYDSATVEHWCRFRPIPPFIVNDRPFSDIQCSLEHEYTMTTGPSLDATRFSGRGADRIYLKKSTSDIGIGESLSRERCNIQCKVNILYQVHLQKRGEESTYNGSPGGSANYYLPVKPCVIVAGDKSRTSSYYLALRSASDATLILAFILLDLILLLESIDTKKFQLEGKKLRLVGWLLIITSLPLIVALMFDLMTDASSSGYQTSKSRREGYLVTLVNERIIPSISSFVSYISSTSRSHAQSMDGGSSGSSKQNNFTQHGVQASFSSSSGQETTRVDHFMVPFFAYAVFMFLLSICSFTLPKFSLNAPLVRVSSIEELGIENEKDRQSQSSEQKIQSPRMMTKSEETKLSRDMKIFHNQARKVATFALTVLFMGLQFNLTQFIQTQIFIETFGNPGIPIGQNYAAVWYITFTHSSAMLLVLLTSSLFLDELSAFFASFSPFRSSTAMEDPKSVTEKNRLRLLTYVTMSSLVYSLRYYSLIKLNPLSRFKWLIASLFQIAEVLNFPLTWFVLTERAHEIFMEHPVYAKYRGSKGSPANTTRALNVHLMIQSALAFTYFILARFIALFAHSLHASLHLHSDNIDWFITNFYRPLQTSSTNSTQPTKAPPKHSSNPSNSSHSFMDSVTPPSPSPSAARTDSLFSPLPDERQTYLHASRLFIKYNSLLCLLIGLSLLVALLYIKYQLWSEQRKTLEVLNQLSVDKADDNIDERLSMDLMRIHAHAQPNTRTIYPTSRSSQEDVRDPDSSPGRHEPQRSDSSPRAKILFHYNIGKQDLSEDESSWMPTRDKARGLHRGRSNLAASSTESLQLPVVHSRGEKVIATERKIPIAIQEEEEGEQAADQQGELLSGDEVGTTERDNQRSREQATVERVVRQRSKRVRIFEDSENWSSTSENDGNAGGDTGAHVVDLDEVSRSGTKYNRWTGDEGVNNRKRTITFAPTTTLIDDISHNSSTSTHDKFGRQRQPTQVNVPAPRRASPEPSIGGDREIEEGEADSVEETRMEDSIEYVR